MDKMPVELIAKNSFDSSIAWSLMKPEQQVIEGSEVKNENAAEDARC